MRVQLRRSKGWRKPSNAVSVTRPGPFGNPFRVVICCKRWHVCGPGDTCPDADWGPWPNKAEAVAAAIGFYSGWIRHPYQRAMRNSIRGTFGPATGKVPACWCGEGQPCHADLIAEIAKTPMEG